MTRSEDSLPARRPADSPAGADAHRCVVRGPDDLIAFVPVAIGFVPHHSVVMLTVSPAGGPHARLDLPERAEDCPALVKQLIGPARKHDLTMVAFIVYTADKSLAERVTTELCSVFTSSDIVVLEAMRVEGNRWFPLLPLGDPDEHEGTVFDHTDHPFAVQAMAQGRATRATREDLRTVVAESSESLVSASVLAAASAMTAADLAQVTRGRVVDAVPFSDEELASVVVSLRDPMLRCQTWLALRRETASTEVLLWCDAARRLPDEDAADVCAVAALAAWLSGDGALSWCAVDRCQERDPAHPLADLVTTLLEEAWAPTQWAELRTLVGADSPAA